MVAAAENTYETKSGRYQFRFWHTDSKGERLALRHAPPDWAGRYPDLIRTAYRNGDGSETVYGIVFDLDAHRAHPKWLDSAGRLDWPKISAYLAETHGKVFSQISYVIRSSGGKGLALLLAINPLPIQKSTEKNQQVALNLQSRLVALLSRLGLGADPGARGVVRDFPNFLNPERCLYENRLAQRRAEQGREPVLRNLHRYLNELEACERRQDRIYNDARAEGGLARLVAWLLGAKDGQEGLPEASFLSGETLWASTVQLQKLTGLSDKFLRRFLNSPPSWLRVEYVEAGWRLSIPLGGSVQRLLPRAEDLLTREERGGGGARARLHCSVGSIKRPELVEDGERNAWLTSLALAYKWHGFSREEAQAKVQLRMAALPGCEYSRNCRQARSIVKAIYRNLPHMAGRFSDRSLPEWLTDDLPFTGGTSLRRGFTPGWTEGLIQKEVLREATSPKLALVAPCLQNLLAEGFGEEVAASEAAAEEPSGKAQGLFGSTAREVSLAAIRWRQRVGLFEGSRLVACFTKRHYRAQAALEFLSGKLEYQGAQLRVYTPHSGRQLAYRDAIESCPDVLQSGLVFGERKTYGEKLAAWRAEKGLSRTVSLDELVDDGVDPVEDLHSSTDADSGWDCLPDVLEHLVDVESRDTAPCLVSLLP
jgi:hypothetical protein